MPPDDLVRPAWRWQTPEMDPTKFISDWQKGRKNFGLVIAFLMEVGRWKLSRAEQAGEADRIWSF
jgi:hypothetical protein